MPRQWHDLVIPLPADWVNGPLRIDPLDRAGLVEIESIRLVGSHSQTLLWGSTPEDPLATVLQIGGTAAVIPHQQTLAMCSHNADVQVYLPQIPSLQEAVEVAIRLRVDIAPDFLQKAFDLCASDVFAREKQTLSLELKMAQAERLVLLADVRQLAADKNALILEQHGHDVISLRDQLDEQGKLLNGILNSLSWKLTAPIRLLMENLRGRRAG